MAMLIHRAVEQAREAAQQAIEEEKKKAAADAQAAEADAAARAAADRAAAARAQKVQAMVDIAYLVAAADGSMSDGEKEKVTGGLKRLSDALDDSTIGQMLGVSAERVSGDGADGVAKAAAGQLEDGELRRAVFMVAAAAAYQSGGVGTKEGLAMQAISRAFGIEMNEMHQLMAEAAKA